MEDKLLLRLTLKPEDPQTEQFLTTATSLHTTTRFSPSAAPHQSSVGSSSAERGSVEQPGGSGGEEVPPVRFYEPRAIYTVEPDGRVTYPSVGDQSPTEIGLPIIPPLPTLQTSALRTPVEALHTAVSALRPIALAAPPPPATAAQQRRTEIAKDGMDLPETFLNKRTTEEQSQPGVVCPSVPAGFSLTSQQISPDAAPCGGRAPEHQDQTRTQEFSSVSRSPPAASSEYPRLSPVKDQVTAPVGPKARDRPKLGGGPSGAGKLPPQEACWHCGSRDPDHLSELCPELPRNKLTAGICERPRCQKPRHPDYVTCWECRKYRRNTERYVLEATPPYIPPATGGATDGYGTGPNAHRSDYSTGQSAPPHPKRWYYVSASTTLPPGTYTYNSLRRHLESQGGWSATDRWSQGSYQGFVEAEPALKRTVQAGLRRPDGSLPVYYD